MWAKERVSICLRRIHRKQIQTEDRRLNMKNLVPKITLLSCALLGTSFAKAQDHAGGSIENES
jgi:hypothetical protein